MMLTLAFCKGEADFQAVGFVLFIDVFNKGLEVLSRFIGFNGFFRFIRHETFLICNFLVSGINYNIYIGMRPSGNCF